MDCTPYSKMQLRPGRQLNVLEPETINKTLLMVAEATVENIEFIINENNKDLVLVNESDPGYDRLLLTPERIKEIASDIRNVC